MSNQSDAAVVSVTAAPLSTERSHNLTLLAGLVIAIGLALRSLVQPGWVLNSCDGRAYHALAVSLVSGRGLYLDDPLVMEACLGITPGPSNHYSPGMPLFEAAFVALLGDSGLAVVLPILLLSWAAVFTVWWTTRDLYGDLPALLVAGAVSIEWTGVFFGTWLGYAENMVLLAIVLTVWAILRALRDDRFMPLAGLFAAVGYLSKASIGWFFLVAGLGGVVWRVVYRGWGVLRNRWYVTAMVIFAIPVAIWSLRNVYVFWDGTASGLIDAWQTSRVFSHYIAAALNDPGQLLVGLVGKLPILIVGLGLPLLPFWRSLLAALRRWREEDTLGLWITAGLIVALGWFFAGVTWLNEGSAFIWPDPVRYVAPAQVPLLWLVVRERPLPSTRAWALMYAILAVLLVVMPYLLIGNLPSRD